MDYIVDFTAVGMDDVATVGGKNASIGEMISNLTDAGVLVPPGFATTAAAYREFLAQDGLDRKVGGLLAGVDGQDVALLAERGAAVRRAVMNTPLPERLLAELRSAYSGLRGDDGSVAADHRNRSATQEDPSRLMRKAEVHGRTRFYPIPIVPD